MKKSQYNPHDQESFWDDHITFEDPSTILMDKEDNIPEEVNPYREISLQFIKQLILSTEFILNAANPLAACYGVRYAYGLCDKSMREIGKELGLSSGTISVYAKQFRLLAGLPPSSLMQPLEQADQSRKNRINQLID